MKKLFIITIILFTIVLNATEKQLILRFGDKVNYPPITFLDKILCLDSNDCYVVTTNSYGFPELFNTVYMTSNQGRTWSLKFDDVISEDSWWTFNIRDFDVVDSNHIYIAMSESSVIKYTEDGGKTIKYLQLPDDKGHRVAAIIMIDTLKGLALKTHDIFRTFDGWKTYDSIPERDYAEYLNPQKKNDSIIWFTPYTINSTVYKKYTYFILEYNINTNQEEIIYAFEKEHTENGEKLYIFDLHFVNDSLGFVCGRRDIGENNDRAWDLIYKTSDGGKSWKNVLKDMNGRPFGIFEISFADEKLGVSVGQEKLYETTDGGETWLFKETPEEFDNPTTRVEFAGQIAIVGEMEGRVWTWQYPDDTTGVSVEDLIKSSKLHVIKRSNDLRIAISDPQYRQYRLEIIDIMGRKVTDKSINSNAAGNVYHSINIKNLNKGSYFFALSFNGAVVHTGKFVK